MVNTIDTRIPGYAISPQLRATLPPEAQGPFGTLPNSASNSDSGSIGAAYVGNKGFAGASYTTFDSDYGTVAEEDVTIKMKQQRIDFAGQWLAPNESIKSVDLKFVQPRYEHTAFEGSEPGTTFKNDGYQTRLDVVHKARHRAFEALHRHAERTFDDVQRRYVATAGEFQEGPQRRQSAIAAVHAVVPLLLQMIQEGQNQRVSVKAGIELALSDAYGE